MAIKILIRYNKSAWVKIPPQFAYGENAHGSNANTHHLQLSFTEKGKVGGSWRCCRNQKVRFLLLTLKSHGVMVIIMGFGPIDSGSTPDGTIAFFGQNSLL